jgi:serine/threonine-protein kinase
VTDTLARLATALADRYRLERELGQGGMATVYLAEDLKHARKVAIKVLHPELSAVIGAERFLAEIRLTAQLQHPHILGLIDSGECERLLYYVMPYVDGETLRARITREKQLRVRDAIRLAGEIAAALEYAHKRNVVHRDIKPENILLQDDQVLVADFGIALAVSQAGGQRMTQTGLSLGTPSYMSPEQAMGEKSVDARSDVYALGAITYEMLVGDPPFTGGSMQVIMSQLLTAKPRPLRESRPNVPPHVEAAVLTALEKLPADRQASAAEFARDLTGDMMLSTEMMRVPATVEMPSVRETPAPAATSRRRYALAGGAVALAALAFAAGTASRSAPPAPVRRYALSLGSVQWSGDPYRSGIALAPDGSSFVYTGPGNEGPSLWLRRRDQLDPVPLLSTAGAVGPFFSPDGTRLGFTSQSVPIRIHTMGIGGTPPQVIADSTVGLDGATWSDDGHIYYDGLTQGGTRGLMRVPEDGGAVEQVTTVDTARGELDHMRPVALPNGRGILFTMVRRDQQVITEIAVLDLRTKEIRTLLRGIAAVWLPPQHLLYLDQSGGLYGVPFDTDRLTLTGEPVTILDGSSPLRAASVHLAAAADGSILYLTQTAAAQSREVVRVNLDGMASPFDPGWRADFRTLGVSPDGSRIAASIFSAGEQHIWIKQLPRGPLSRLTFEWAPNARPTWTPDGTRVLYNAVHLGRGLIGRRHADGTGSAETAVVLAQVPVNEAVPSRDGQWLVFRTAAGDILGLHGADTVRLLATPAQEIAPALSPDGRWLAYSSNESQRYEVYVRPFPNVQDGKWLVSTGGGGMPRWAPDGRTLYFATLDSLMAVPVTPGPTPTFGAQRGLFPTAPYVMGGHSWDVMPDGGGFAMIRLANQNDRPELVMVERLDRELEQGAAKR